MRTCDDIGPDKYTISRAILGIGFEIVKMDEVNATLHGREKDDQTYVAPHFLGREADAE